MKKLVLVVVMSLLFSIFVYGQGGWTDGGTVVRLTTSTDSIGIGTSSPSAKLDIANLPSSNDLSILVMSEPSAWLPRHPRRRGRAGCGPRRSVGRPHPR